mmetsp:Transcript_74544/g.242010  ORF Transcript_74544/g.242010 Transcript_74544/m.242010 type:complete len:267 (+) Transcript_74544:920-1720(+)
MGPCAGDADPHALVHRGPIRVKGTAVSTVQIAGHPRLLLQRPLPGLWQAQCPHRKGHRCRKCVRSVPSMVRPAPAATTRGLQRSASVARVHGWARRHTHRGCDQGGRGGSHERRCPMSGVDLMRSGRLVASPPTARVCRDRLRREGRLVAARRPHRMRYRWRLVRRRPADGAAVGAGAEAAAAQHAGRGRHGAGGGGVGGGGTGVAADSGEALDAARSRRSAKTRRSHAADGRPKRMAGRRHSLPRCHLRAARANGQSQRGRRRTS